MVLSKKTNPTINALIVMSSMALSIVAAELFVRWFVPVRDVGPSLTVYDPVMGKRIKKNFRTTRVTPEFTMRFSSNSLGYRGDEKDVRGKGGIVFLGDSFTMGYGVNDGEQFPEMIESLVSTKATGDNVSVLNAGMGNSGQGRWVKLLRTEIDRFSPRVVVLQVTGNDFDDNVREGLFALGDGDALQELPVRSIKMKALEPYLDRIPGLSSSYLFGLVRQVAAAGLRPVSQSANLRETVGQTHEDYAYRLTRRLIEESLSICTKRHYGVVAVLVELEGDKLERIVSLFESKAVPVFVAPRKIDRPDLYYKIDGHWNASGHLFVARQVLKLLESTPSFKG